MKTRYADVCDINEDQAKVIADKGWVVFTEGDEGGSYFQRGYHWANRIGYIILNEDVKQSYYDNINMVARYDDDFQKEVNDLLKPLEDKCYVFYVENPDYKYAYECLNQVWTNKGEEGAKEIANKRFGKFYYELAIADPEDGYSKYEERYASKFLKK